ncbi:MAG: hypothetical protein IKY52_12170 [Clostridia bacterium]|nr:hypothetical protein [Clostridia bacterium]
MQITEIHSGKRGFFLTSVRFEAEEAGGRKEIRQAEAMNRFYEALEKAAAEYAEVCSAEYPMSRYDCEIRARQAGEEILITICLRHRLPGETSRRRTGFHRWRGGLLREEKCSDSIVLV